MMASSLSSIAHSALAVLFGSKLTCLVISTTGTTYKFFAIECFNSWLCYVCCHWCEVCINFFNTHVSDASLLGQKTRLQKRITSLHTTVFLLRCVSGKKQYLLEEIMCSETNMLSMKEWGRGVFDWGNND